MSNNLLIDGQFAPKIFQINISNGGVPKFAIQSVDIVSTGLLGDRQRNQAVHGGPDRAVTLFSLEHILGLQSEGHPVFPGALGENITVAGIDWDEMKPGVRLQLGEQVIIEITKFTSPCENLIPYLVEGDFSRVSQKRYPGWSRVAARVITSGRVSIGDRVLIIKETGD